MAISLNKGGNLSLSKTDPSLNQVLIGLGWDVRATDGADFDLMLLHFYWLQMIKFVVKLILFL